LSTPIWRKPRRKRKSVCTRGFPGCLFDVPARSGQKNAEALNEILDVLTGRIDKIIAAK